MTNKITNSEYTNVLALICKVKQNEIYRIEYIYDVYEYQRTKKPCLSYEFTSQQICDAIYNLKDLREMCSSDIEVRGILEQGIGITGRLKNNKPLLPKYPPNRVQFIKNALGGCAKSLGYVEEYAAMLIAINLDYIDYTMTEMEAFALQRSGSLDDYEFDSTIRIMDEDNNADFIEEMCGSIIEIPNDKLSIH